MGSRRKESASGSRSGFRDEELLGRLLAHPDLDDGVQSLEYWRRRSQRLPWYRIRARREALRMTARWEGRVLAAVISPRAASLEARVSAGVLLGRTRLARWTRRARTAVLATVAAVALLVALPLAAMLLYLAHAL